MIDWSSSMQQTYEFYQVDPENWSDLIKIDTIISCDITWDLEKETLGYATFKTTEQLGEMYIRVYLIVIQNGIEYKLPLGTFIVQTPSLSFNGKTYSVELDAYSPLLELKDNMPPLGYTVKKDINIVEQASALVSNLVRAPVVESTGINTLRDDFVANPDDNWLTYISSLLAEDDYSMSIDETGKIMFEPNKQITSMHAIYTFDDSNSSILYPDISFDRDLYGIPNVVEVIYSNNNQYLTSRIVNDDPNSITSTVSRGREIVHRETNPKIPGIVIQTSLDSYAKKLLRDLSSLEYKITYKHGYCPVRIGDCVMLNYNRAGLKNIKAKVISQNISCVSGCPVSETAIYTDNLWGD